MNNAGKWDTHYTRDRSVLIYPDENLVRMLAPFLSSRDAAALVGADIGCGTGRHLRLMAESGIGTVIGVDYSVKALEVTRGLYPFPLACAGATALPFKNECVDIAVAWGSLHYSRKEELPVMLSEIRRILKRGGRLFGTLRTHRDTSLRSGTHIGNNMWITDLKDIERSVISCYDEDELRAALSPFAGYEYGIMERSPLGKPESLISHWYFRAEK